MQMFIDGVRRFLLYKKCMQRKSARTESSFMRQVAYTVFKKSQSTILFYFGLARHKVY